ncbi:MAG: glutathione S-transferase family protein [Gemmobacter sp.]
MTGTLTFYTNPNSRGAMVRWMLEETGADYETVVLDYGPPMKAPGYLAINPMGKVPAVRRGDTVVTECAAICCWLADVFPEAGLAPDPAERGAWYRWLFFGAGPLEAAVTNRALGVEVPEEKHSFVGYGDFDRVMETLEAAVAAGPYLAGERFSAADVYVGAQIGWGMMFGTVPKRPGFEDYWARLSARPAYLRAQALDDELRAKGAGDGGE